MIDKNHPLKSLNRDYPKHKTSLILFSLIRDLMSKDLPPYKTIKMELFYSGTPVFLHIQREI